MFKVSLQEIIALEMVLKYTTIKDLIEQAAISFANSDKEVETACITALDTFLR